MPRIKSIGSQRLYRPYNEFSNEIENWNSANGFIFYGKGGEISSNKLEDQEISVLALHLFQNCLVYINTLMVQQVVKEHDMLKIFNKEDLRAINPLFYSHINPYGSFELNMMKRIPLDI